MLNVEKWAQGKPTIIAISAVQLVTFSDFLYEVIPQAKERRLFSNKTNEYERINAATHKLAITDFNDRVAARKSTKVMLAAIISSLSQLAGKRFTSTQISALFHAYAYLNAYNQTPLPLSCMTRAVPRDE